MAINSAKSWFAVDRSVKLVFFADYINVKKGHSVVFFIHLDISFTIENGQPSNSFGKKIKS